MPGSEFQKTSWSLILAASSRSTSHSRQALATLCQTYWNPVYAFIRRNGHDPDRAEDLTQDFFARLIEKKFWEAADQKRGRFRSFLMVSVKHFLTNEWDRTRAIKRGGGQPTVSIDKLEAERWYLPASRHAETPERLFERRWALSLLERVMQSLKSEYEASGKSMLFETLVVFLNRDGDPIRYEELAASSGMSVGALRTSVYRLRQKYHDLLRAEIAETVETPDLVDEEIRFLLATLSGK